MRRLVAVAVLAVLIIAPCVAGYLLISDFEQTLGEILQQAYDTVEQEDYEKAAELAAHAEQYFETKEKIITVFTDHELIENLGSQLSRLSPLASEETKTEFASEVKAARIMLTHILTDQLPSLHNIL